MGGIGRVGSAGVVALALALAVLLPAPCRAGESCYVIVFAFEGELNLPRFAHTFATFVRTSWPGDGPCAGPVSLESYTISWLPRNLKIRVLK